MPEAFEQQFPGGSASANAAIRALVETYDVTMRVADQGMHRYGLSPSARQALATIDGAGGALTQSEIADRLLTTPPSVSSLVATLERRGLVARERDAADGRRQIVRITRAGRELVHRFVPEAVALQTAIMRDVGEADRRRLIRILTRIRETAATVDADAVVAGVVRIEDVSRDE